MELIEIKITYCAAWHYEPRAVSLTANLLAQWGQNIKALTLVPSSGGVFEIELNGELIYSKAKTGRHADDGEVEDILEKKIKQ